MLRALLFSTATALLCYVVAGVVTFPVERNLTIFPGTTMGFEFSEENLFEMFRFSGPVDCVSFSFNSTRPMNAALFFERWDYIKDYVNNHTVPPPDREGIVPGSECAPLKWLCALDVTFHRFAGAIKQPCAR